MFQTCRHCSHEFCWICMGNWQNHNNCNRFDEMKTHLHAEFERFKHFQDRYGNQMESLRLEDILYRNLNEKVNELKETFSMTNNEVRIKFNKLIDCDKYSIRNSLTY